MLAILAYMEKKSHLTRKTIHEVDTIFYAVYFEGEGTEAQSGQWTCARSRG